MRIGGIVQEWPTAISHLLFGCPVEMLKGSNVGSTKYTQFICERCAEVHLLTETEIAKYGLTTDHH